MGLWKLDHPPSSSRRAELLYRRQLELAELDFGTFCLQGDLAFADRAVGAVVDQVAVDPNLDGIAHALHDHRVPR